MAVAHSAAVCPYPCRRKEGIGRVARGSLSQQEPLTLPGDAQKTRLCLTCQANRYQHLWHSLHLVTIYAKGIILSTEALFQRHYSSSQRKTRCMKIKSCPSSHHDGAKFGTQVVWIPNPCSFVKTTLPVFREGNGASTFLPTNQHWELITSVLPF